MPTRLRIVGGMIVALGLTLALAAAACGSAKPGRPLALPAARSLAASSTSHVVVVVMENREYTDVIGNGTAPYINRLARSSAVAGNYFAVSHPSLPNYLALTGGQTFGITSDCTDCVAHGTSLGDQLAAAGLSWGIYIEDLPGPCSQTAFAGGYAKKHDPFMYFPSIANDPSRCSHVVPLTQLPHDLAAGKLPDFVWITPNLCDDGHDCPLSSADRFLAHTLPALLSQLGPRGFLALTWDEGSSNRGCCHLAQGGRVATILTGPQVRRGVRKGGPFDHYSLLRTIEDAFGLSHLANAGCACTKPLSSLFKTAPRRIVAARNHT